MSNGTVVGTGGLALSPVSLVGKALRQHSDRRCNRGRHLDWQSDRHPSQVTSRRPPSCDVACCGGVVAGSWQSPSLSDPGRRDYVPDEAADCSYFSYSKSELIGKLLGEVRALAAVRCFGLKALNLQGFRSPSLALCHNSGALAAGAGGREPLQRLPGRCVETGPCRGARLPSAVCILAAMLRTGKCVKEPESLASPRHIPCFLQHTSDVPRSRNTLHPPICNVPRCCKALDPLI